MGARLFETHIVYFLTYAMRPYKFLRLMKTYVYLIHVTLVCEYSGLKKDVANHILKYLAAQKFVKHKL